jgi:hypothetical protein
MSGGSFNHACSKVAAGEHFQALDDVKSIARHLREHGKHDAADVVLRYIIAVETAQRRLAVWGAAIEPLLRSVEWWASGDYSGDAVDERMKAITIAPLKPAEDAPDGDA